MRVVLDANVLVAAVLSPSGVPAQILRRWFDGEFELVVSEHLLLEVSRALGYDRLRTRVSPDDARAFVDRLPTAAVLAPDTGEPPARSSDQGDDYLVALAAQEQALLVSGDRHLLGISGLPIYAPRAFLEMLDA